MQEIERGLKPTAARDKVVLCKDCQFWQGNNGGYPHPECRWGHDETPDADDYCSFAERLEETDEAVQMVMERLEALRGETETD